MVYLEGYWNKEGIKSLLQKEDLDSALRRSLQKKLEQLEANETILK